jgi:hypothetical protein
MRMQRRTRPSTKLERCWCADATQSRISACACGAGALELRAPDSVSLRVQKALRARLAAELESAGTSTSDRQELQVRLWACRPERYIGPEPAMVCACVAARKELLLWMRSWVSTSSSAKRTLKAR